MMYFNTHLHIYILIFITLTEFTNGQLIWHLLHDGENKTKNDHVPVVRRDMGLGYDSNRNNLILFGGRSKGNEVLDDTWIFEISTNSWREVSNITSPPGRFSFVYGLSRDNFYITTGEGKDGHLYNDVWRFHLVTETWKMLHPQQKPPFYISHQWYKSQQYQMMPSARYGASGGILDNSTQFYVSMGFGNERSGDTVSYNTHTLGWFNEYASGGLYRPDNPHKRCHHASTMLSPDEFLIFGGCMSGGGTGGACPASDTWIYNGKTKSWSSINGCATGRIHASLAMLPSLYGERRVVLYGGIEDSLQVILTSQTGSDQLGIFNPDTKKWVLRRSEGNIPSKRASMSMVTGKDGIFMFGGADVDGETLHNDIYLLMGTSYSADQAPIHTDCNTAIINLILLHEVLMVLGWGFFLQWGAFLARHTRNRNPLWFHLHRLFQIFGLLLAIAGFITGVVSVKMGHFQFAHAILGLLVMILGMLQPINALMRPTTPFDCEIKTKKRIIWEYFHKYSGRITLLLAICNISMGLFLALVHQILWAAWFAYVIVLMLCYIMAEIRKNFRKRINERHAKLAHDNKSDSSSKYVKPEGNSKGGSLFEHDSPIGQLPKSTKQDNMDGKFGHDNKALVSE